MQLGYLGRANPSYRFHHVGDYPILRCPTADKTVRRDYSTYIMSGTHFTYAGWGGPWHKVGRVPSKVMYFTEQGRGFAGWVAHHSQPDGAANANFGNISDLHSGGANILFVDGRVEWALRNQIISPYWSGW